MLRNETKDVCASMSELIHRTHDGASALHLAAAIPENTACVQLITSRLPRTAFDVRDAQGLTPLQLAVQRGHAHTAVGLMHRGAPPAQLGQPHLRRALPWVAEHGNDQLLRDLCGALEPDAETAATLQEALCLACKYRCRSAGDWSALGVRKGCAAGMHWKGGEVPPRPPPGRPAYAQPLSP